MQKGKNQLNNHKTLPVTKLDKNEKKIYLK